VYTQTAPNTTVCIYTTTGAGPISVAVWILWEFGIVLAVICGVVLGTILHTGGRSWQLVASRWYRFRYDVFLYGVEDLQWLGQCASSTVNIVSVWDFACYGNEWFLISSGDTFGIDLGHFWHTLGTIVVEWAAPQIAWNQIVFASDSGAKMKCKITQDHTGLEGGGWALLRIKTPVATITSTNSSVPCGTVADILVWIHAYSIVFMHRAK